MKNTVLQLLFLEQSSIRKRYTVIWLLTAHSIRTQEAILGKNILLSNDVMPAKLCVSSITADKTSKNNV